MNLINLICAKSKLQRKALSKLLTSRDEVYWRRAEIFTSHLMQVLKADQMDIEYVADAYLSVCKDMVREQFKFKKTGRYSCGGAKEAYDKVYSCDVDMTAYIYALALSQFLWANHYAMYEYFVDQCKTFKGIGSYLEIGPGFGLYLAEAQALFPGTRFKAIDISPSSIRAARAYITQLNGHCDFQVRDVYAENEGQYDCIVMSEVIEHVDNPKDLLRKIHGMLHDDGRFFVTTCANSPAIDHVYLYNSVEHIREEIRECGYTIATELALPVGAYEEAEWEEKKVEVNYAAVLKKT